MFEHLVCADNVGNVYLSGTLEEGSLETLLGWKIGERAVLEANVLEKDSVQTPAWPDFMHRVSHTFETDSNWNCNLIPQGRTSVNIAELKVIIKSAPRRVEAVVHTQEILTLANQLFGTRTTRPWSARPLNRHDESRSTCDLTGCFGQDATNAADMTAISISSAAGRTDIT